MPEIHLSTQPDSSGQEIARVYLKKSTEPEQIEKDSRDTLNDGFEAITANPGSTIEEKTLAELGKAFKTNIPERYPSSMAMLSLMHHIATAIPAPGPAAEIIARECLSTSRDMGRFYAGETTSLAIFSTAFEAIAATPSASDDEKKVAQLGSKIADMPLYKKDGLIGSHIIISSLAKTLTSPASAVIPRICVNAGFNVSLPTSARYILDQGFEALQNETGLSQKEKTLIDLGLKIAGSSEDNYVASFAKLALMDAVASSIPGTIGQIISQVAVDTVDIIDDESGSLEVLDRSFKTIIESPLSNEEERTLARKGLSPAEDTDKEKKNIILGRKFIVMNRIANLHDKPDTEKHGGPEIQSPSITVDDDDETVSLGSLRLERNKR